MAEQEVIQILGKNPDYSEEGLIRTLNAIVITFTRSDYITYIYIYTSGNINCFGVYTNKEGKSPSYNTHLNMRISNWLLENNFLTLES